MSSQPSFGRKVGKAPQGLGLRSAAEILRRRYLEGDGEEGGGGVGSEGLNAKPETRNPKP